MRNLILTHLLDLLAADARLIAGGRAWTAGFAGVRRVKNGDLPACGWINIFDHAYTPTGTNHRPAIYVGTPGFGSADRLEAPSVSSIRTEFRQLTLPLIVCSEATGLLAAEQQRDQIANSIRLILLDHLVEPGYWYEIEAPGDTGSAYARMIPTVSATGQEAQGAAEAIAPVPIVVRYTFGPGSPA